MYKLVDNPSTRNSFSVLNGRSIQRQRHGQRDTRTRTQGTVLEHKGRFGTQGTVLLTPSVEFPIHGQNTKNRWQIATCFLC